MSVFSGERLSKELHGPVARRFPRRKVIVDGIDDTWAMDLVDMSEWKYSNDGNAWMLNVVDVFSRYAWAVPLPNKTAAVVLRGFQHVIESSGRQPKKIWVDEGTEFYNRLMTTYINQNGIIRYSTYGEHKSMMVERFNRTLKSRMWRRFTELNTRRWVDMLPNLLEAYNRSKHRSIKMTPIEASKKKNEQELLDVQNKALKEQTEPPSKKPKFELGQWVRISRVKGIFEKGYLPNWSREIFKVVSILHTNPRVYGIEDISGEPIKGNFYEQQLKQTDETPSGEFLVERVIKTKTLPAKGSDPDRKGKKLHLVKWLGYSDKFNRWIEDTDITQVFKEPKTKESKQQKETVAKSSIEIALEQDLRRSSRNRTINFDYWAQKDIRFA